MKITKALTTAITLAYGLTHDQASAALSAGGLYRSAHCMDTIDFDNYRLDQITGFADGKLTYASLAKQGTLPKGTKPVLTMSLADLSYTPLLGEQLMCLYADDGEHYPVVCQGVNNGLIDVGGIYDEEKWDTQITPEQGFAQVYHLTGAGPITLSAFNHFFSTFELQEVESGELRSLTTEDFDVMSGKLEAEGLTFSDLYEYLTVSEDDIKTTKYYKKHAKAKKSLDFCTITELVTDELVTVEDMEAEEQAPEVTGFEADKAVFDAYVDELKGADLKNLYTAICKKAKISDDAKETTAKAVKAHIQTLIDSEKKLQFLVTAGQYTPA